MVFGFALTGTQICNAYFSGLAFTLLGAPAMAVEEPKFTIVLHKGGYEIRDYRAAIAAEVIVTGDQWAAASKGFRMLAGYIFGGNRRLQSIAMTAPVAQERAGEKIAVTAPVTQTASRVPGSYDPPCRAIIRLRPFQSRTMQGLS